MKEVGMERDEKIIRELQAKLLSKIQTGDKCGAGVVYSPRR